MQTGTRIHSSDTCSTTIGGILSEDSLKRSPDGALSKYPMLVAWFGSVIPIFLEGGTKGRNFPEGKQRENQHTCLLFSFRKSKRKSAVFGVNSVCFYRRTNSHKLILYPCISIYYNPYQEATQRKQGSFWGQGSLYTL